MAAAKKDPILVEGLNFIHDTQVNFVISKLEYLKIRMLRTTSKHIRKYIYHNPIEKFLISQIIIYMPKICIKITRIQYSTTTSTLVTTYSLYIYIYIYINIYKLSFYIYII